MLNPSLNWIGSLHIRTGSRQQLKQVLMSGISSHSQSIGFLNPHVYNQIKTNAAVRDFLEKCDFVALDGVGVSIPARIRNLRYLSRIVMDSMFEEAISRDLLKGSALLIGLPAEENALACEKIAKASPRLSTIQGVHGFYSTEDYKRILREHTSIDYVLVGMGTPRSEEILLLAKDICTHALCWHIGGGTLRTWAGTKRRTPDFVSTIGCIWIHRIIFEPQTRDRYTTGFIKFLYHLVIDSLISYRK